MPTDHITDSPVAVCFLKKENDRHNQCLLTEKSLVITRKGKTASFLLPEVTCLSLNSRKMMLPLIAGGIFAPLSILAIDKNLFEPWAILTWLILNLFLFYFGWMGYSVLTVEHNGIHQDFPVKYPGENLKAFIKFVNEYLRMSGKEAQVSPVYHILSADVWEIARNHPSYAPETLKPEGFIHLCTKDQLPRVLDRHFKNKEGLLALCINPIKLKAALKYETVYEQEGLYPHLFGPINLDAVINVEAIQR